MPGLGGAATAESVALTNRSYYNPEILSQALDCCDDGIAIADARLPDMPLVYVNPAFETLTGYEREQIIGRNCRVLQGEETDAGELERLRAAIAAGERVRVTLRNYRRDGTPFWNELSLSPMADGEGTVTHYVGVLRDATDNVGLRKEALRAREELQRLNTEVAERAADDQLTGLSNRRHFAVAMDQMWRIARREQRPLGVLLVDIDRLAAINDRWGQPVGDACLVAVARVLDGCLKRASDCVARYGGEEFIALTLGLDRQALRDRCETVRREIEALRVPAGDGGESVRLTVSIGLAVAEPTRANSPESLVHRAEQGLQAAKSAGCNRVTTLV